MTTDPPPPSRHDALFGLLVAECVQMAYIGLGKIVNPATGQTEVHLDQAEYFIDRLDMLEAKTQGNLSQPEAAMLRRTLTELRLNFVNTRREQEARPDEAEAPSAPEPAADTSPPAEPPPPDEPAAPSDGDDSKRKFHKSYGSE